MYEKLKNMLYYTSNFLNNLNNLLRFSNIYDENIQKTRNMVNNL